MSKSKSTTKQSNQSSSTVTTTPNAPAAITNPIFGAAERIDALGRSQDPFVAGASDLQQQAFGQAGNLTTSPNYGMATDMGIAAGMAPSERAQAFTFSRDQLNQYMNPFLDEVQGAFTTDFDANAGRVGAMQASQAAANGGARNSNNAIRDAVTAGELARARGSGIAGIRTDAYRAALSALDADNARRTSVSQFNAGQSQADLNRQLSSAGLLANIGQAEGADRRANIGLTADLGAEQRNIENAQLQGDIAREQAVVSLLGGLPLSPVVGQTSQGTSQSSGTTTQTSSPGLLQSLGGLAMGLGGLGWSPFGASAVGGVKSQSSRGR